MKFLGGLLTGLALGAVVTFSLARYQITPGNTVIQGVQLPVFLKLDRYTGVAWFSTDGGKWKLVEYTKPQFAHTKSYTAEEFLEESSPPQTTGFVVDKPNWQPPEASNMVAKPREDYQKTDVFDQLDLNSNK